VGSKLAVVDGDCAVLGVAIESEEPVGMVVVGRPNAMAGKKNAVLSTVTVVLASFGSAPVGEERSDDKVVGLLV